MKSSMPFLAAITFLLFTGCVTTPETGRSALILTSESQENALGLQAYSDVRKKEKLSSNARWTAIVQRVGKRIAAAANKPEYQWEFSLFESPTQNAFCLPGGKVAIYTGLLSVAQTEAGLAAVMGHEVAHATARHGGQRMTMALGTQALQMGAAVALGADGSQEKNLLMGAIGAGATVGMILPFSRGNESEADEMGLIYMARAGYEPSEASRFWERFAASAKGGTPTFLSTHPSSESRQQALAAQVPKVQGLYERSPKYGLGERF